MKKLQTNTQKPDTLNNMMAFSVMNDKIKTKKIEEIESKSDIDAPISYTSSELIFHQDNLVWTDEKANILVAWKGETLITLRYKVANNSKVSCPYMINSARKIIDPKGAFYYVNNVEHWFNFKGTTPKNEWNAIFCVYSISEADKNSIEWVYIWYNPTEEWLAKSPNLKDIKEFEWSDSKLTTEMYKLGDLWTCIKSMIRDTTRDVPFNYCAERDAEVERIIAGESQSSDEYTLEKVVDWDTIRVKDSSWKSIDVRMIWIDAPESNELRYWYAECYGDEATEKLKTILGNTTKVKIEKDATQWDYDSYNRLLGYVFINGTTNVNQLMIYYGYAWEYTYNKPYKYQSDFKNAEASAKSESRWLWSSSACSWQRKQKTTTTSTSSSSYSYRSSACAWHTWHLWPKGWCYYYNWNSKVYWDHSCCY